MDKVLEHKLQLYFWWWSPGTIAITEQYDGSHGLKLDDLNAANKANILTGLSTAAVNAGGAIHG